jgi:hypothetical protein
VGTREWLRSLPGLVVCGGLTGDGPTREVWRLGLERLVWERLPNLLTRPRGGHACCVVLGGTLVALGGMVDPFAMPGGFTASVEVQDTRAAGDAALSRELPQLSCGSIYLGRALVGEQSESEAGQVLLLGGLFIPSPGAFMQSSEAWDVDLATGVCTPRPPLGHARSGFAVARLPGGRVVCVGGAAGGGAAPEMWEPTLGTWRDLPAMSAGRYGAAGCVLSDGRFAILGGTDAAGDHTSSCAALVLDGTERWESVPPMRRARCGCAAAAVGGCVIVTGGAAVQGGASLRSVEVYEEAAGVWRRLRPACNLPRELCWMGTALL